ncbi:MAG: carbohydrate binding domain-containing protein, partial [Armatimonadetes bacterium]|nr:carbohydrate binding domain-containing protein [Armatimonadota bacterium]
MFARSWLVVLAVVGGPLAFAQPLLVNGDFEAGTADWALSQQEMARADFGTVAADSPAGGLAARVQIIHPDQPHRLQLMHDFPTGALTPGEAYELRFWARSQPGNAISVHVFNRDRPWSSLGVGRGLDLTDQWQEFRFPFRCRATPQPASKVDFFLGACTGVVWLDGVTIEPFTREPAAGAIRLEGEAWSASLTERGAVAEFVQRPGGQRLIAGAKGDPVYALAVAGEHGTRTLTDKDARGVAGEAADGTRRFRFDHGDIKVTCEVAVTADGLLAFTASVTNRGNEAVTGVRYPILRAPIQLGEHSADDAILLPAFDGGICENPKEAVPALGGFEAYYPGPASCQVLAYYDPRAGLYMAAQDAAGTPKRFTLNADVDFGFGFQHLFPTVPGRDAVPGYPVVIGTFVGDWQDAAALYREWSRKQAWCATPLRQKTPAWLARGALVTSFDPRRFSLDQLQAYLARFRALYGAPLIANSRGWERWGMWTGQEYLPPLPSE